MRSEIDIEGTFCVSSAERKGPDKRFFRTEITDGNNNGIGDLFYYSFEEKTVSVFEPDHKYRFADRFARYKLSDYYYSDGAFCRLTSGIGGTKTFRRLLNGFISSSRAEKIGNNCYASFCKNGEIAARDVLSGEIRTDLSQSLRIVFDFICFIKVNEFWKFVEDVRDMHYIDKPLFIKELSDRTDGTTDVYPLIERAKQTGRQIFVTALTDEGLQRVKKSGKIIVSDP